MKINEKLFPFLVLAAYGFILAESYFYIGFLRKYIFVDSRILTVLALTSGSFLMHRKHGSLVRLTFYLNNFVFYVSAFLFLVMQFLEAGKFHNYVFSQVHVQPANFLYLVALSGGLFLIDKLGKLKRVVIKLNLTNVILLTSFFTVFLGGFIKVVGDALYSDFYIFRHINASYDEKMSERWGFYYDYMLFVVENTPDNARILIPPQETPWLSTGNGGLDRYFLYPRPLGNGKPESGNNFDSYDYVMMVWGEWNDAPKEKYGWPKEDVPAEEVIYFDPETLKISKVEGDYNPIGSSKVGVWGLIKVKK